MMRNRKRWRHQMEYVVKQADGAEKNERSDQQVFTWLTMSIKRDIETTSHI